MRRIIGLLFMITALCAGVSFGADDTSDLWDMKQGCQVIRTSGVLKSSDIRNMFGASYGTIELTPGEFRTLFKDGFGDGYNHWVAWKTANPIRLSGFRLHILSDEPRAANRSIKAFYLYASKDGPPWGRPVYSKTDFQHPYSPQETVIDYCFVIPIDAQYFMAEFIQYDGVAGAAGPRVLELNGYSRR